MESTKFKVHGLTGRVVESVASQNFTCELVILSPLLGDMMIVVVSFGHLRRDTAAIFPLDGFVVNTKSYCESVLNFYETFRADVWSDLYKDQKRAL